MTNRIRDIALALFVCVIAVGIGVASLSAFIAGLTALQVAAWCVSLALSFLAGLSVWRVTTIQRRREPDVIDATPAPALPEPRWIATSAHTFARSDALDARAEKIAQLLRDKHLEPTRANIKAVGMECGVNGNEAASMIYKRFVAWGWAVEVQQGQPGRWA